MPNNILIVSEKLLKTQAPWRIQGSLIGQLTPDHDVIAYESLLDLDTYSRSAKKIVPVLYNRLQRSYNKISFVGFDSDSKILLDLVVRNNFHIDVAAIINNTAGRDFFTPLLASTKLYNFYTRKHFARFEIEGAEINEYVRTILPPHMSNRLAKEIAACIIYDGYEELSLPKVVPTFTYV